MAVAALMLGVVGAGAGIPQAHAGAGVPQVQDGASAEPNDVTTIVLEDAVDSDWPPGPSIIAIL